PGELETYLEMAEHGQTAARVDFEKALQLAPSEPKVYLAMAESTAKSGLGRDEVRRILEDGLKKVPTSVELYLVLASIEREGGQLDKAIEILEDGVKVVSEPGPLHRFLAEWLAERGDTGKLNFQIEELESIGYSPDYVKYLRAYYDFNKKDFLKARQGLL